MGLYDREYMRTRDAGRFELGRRPGHLASLRRAASRRLTGIQAVGFVMGASAIIMMLIGIAFS